MVSTLPTLLVVLAVSGEYCVSGFIEKPILEEYDFIVVGSGPGGATVASRLSENPEWEVLLLEAGDKGTDFQYIPAMSIYLRKTQYNWQFSTEPQPGACLGYKGGRCDLPRGKGLGGTSLINGIAYTRGHKVDYDLWAENGCTGWSFDEIEPYFLKSENIMIPELENSPDHMKGGPLNVEYTPYRSPVSIAFLKAGEELGFKLVDYNSQNGSFGFSRTQETMMRGRRVSSYTSFLQPIENRPNLQISINSIATKVIINPETKTAEGVEIIRENITYSIKAKKEVILSAGAVQTPQLLMLSGVGPKSHLEEIGITVLEDLPVGENLQDHVSLNGLVFINKKNAEKDPPLLDSLFEYYDKGEGLLTVPDGSIETLAFASTKLNDNPLRPDLELLFYRKSVAKSRIPSMKDKIFNESFRPIQNEDSWTIAPIALHPKSRGKILLRSKNPLDKPKIFPNHFENTHDLDTIVEGVKLTLNLIRANSFKKFGTTLNHLPLKDCSYRSKLGSDDYYRCVTRLLTKSINHLGGSAKMGADNDPTTVVNPRLQVKNIKHLRVVDASIMPELPSAHPQAAVYMIGEKASDMIKADWEDNANLTGSYCGDVQ